MPFFFFNLKFNSIRSSLRVMGWESPDSVTSEKYAEERKDSGAVPPWRCILVWGVAPYTSLVVSTSACTLERARSFDTFR